MAMDPVVVLSHELSTAEQALKEARVRKDEKTALRLIARISLLNEDLYNVVPTSALGAAELLRRAALSLPTSAATYAHHMMEIANRLTAGTRNFTDLIWLRSMRPALTSGLCGQEGIIVAPLIALAIKGASIPIVVFRAVLPPPDDDAWMRKLSRPV
jgi:hypothetical protein